MNDSDTQIVSRPAAIGDVGIVRDLSCDPNSGLATLAIETTIGDIVTLFGDWRMLQMIYDDLQGEQVEIVKSEGSAYGCHGIRPTGGDDGWN